MVTGGAQGMSFPEGLTERGGFQHGEFALQMQSLP